ncbi:MAG: DUF4956 domain-containing protein [bacterium]|nr:DUF4956 domain-containing protein [bacterium]
MGKMDLISYIQSANAALTAWQVITNMLVTLIVATFIYWVYKRTYTGVMYSRSFNVTILLTTMVTAMVMMVIGTNLALSLGMVGALSVIRFRAAIKDPKDIGFIFWGISVGLSAGTGAYVIAVIGSVIIAMILVIVQQGALEHYPYLLVVKGTAVDEEKLRNIIAARVEKYSLRMKNNNRDGTEIIYEIRFVEGMEDIMISEIREMENISIVNIVSYKGEIAG